jgi:hypothetical protein
MLVKLQFQVVWAQLLAALVSFCLLPLTTQSDPYRQARFVSNLVTVSRTAVVVRSSLLVAGEATPGRVAS